MALCAASGLCLAAQGGETIETYRVPKTLPVLTKPSVAAAATAAAAAATGAKPITWTTPKGWVEQPAKSMRIGQFLVPGANGTKAELAITVFSGLIGDEISNVNRWRAELGLPPIASAEIASEAVTVGDKSGKLYTFTKADKSTAVAWLIKDETSWFFKLRGDTAAVTAAKPALVEFLKSVRFVDAPIVDAGESINLNSAVNPHLPEAVTNLPASHPVIDRPAETVTGLAPLVRQPMWDIPASWREQTASRMVLRSFQITGTDAKAMITISTFPGEVGGVLANVNRWRNQVGLDEIKDTDLAKATEPVIAGDDKGTLMDVVGKDGKTRLIAVYMPHGASTWFYKIQGDTALVASEKANLIKVVKSVRYP
jgi:hypothetical protein